MKLSPAANHSAPRWGGKVAPSVFERAHRVGRPCPSPGREQRQGGSRGHPRRPRGDEPPVQAEATTEPGDEEGRRPTDRRVHRDEHEERRVLAAGPIGEHAVSADAGGPVRRKLNPDHAHVVGVAVAIELAQAAGDAEPAARIADRYARQVEPPRRGVERRRPRQDQLEVVDTDCEPGQARSAVDEDRDRLDRPVLSPYAESQLVDVERSEGLLDRQPPGSVAFAGAQVDLHGAACRVHGESGREARLGRLGVAGVVAGHEAGGDRVAARLAERQGEVVELEVAAALLFRRTGEAALVPRMRSDRADRDAEVDEVAALRVTRRGHPRRG